MRRKDETVKKTILQCARSIALQEGIRAVNIRNIAKTAGIATGTVYNYYSSKDDILLELTEEYWNQTLLEMQQSICGGTFVHQLHEIYLFLRTHLKTAALLMSGLRTTGIRGHERMYSMQHVLYNILLKRLQQDEAIKPNTWSEEFTEQKYTGFLLTNVLAALQTNQPDINVLLEIIKRTLY